MASKSKSSWRSKLKKLGRAVVCRTLERQVKRLRAKREFKVIAVAGSVGKTSTKAAIAKTLEAASLRVAWQAGNYNDRVTVPLIFFNQDEPSILNVLAWLRIFWQNSRMMRRPYPYDVVVVELGSDGPGQMQHFSYTQPDIAVLTAIMPEHMAYFGTLDAVAAEELDMLRYSKQALINIDDTPAKYLEGRQFMSYGLDGKADYQVLAWRQLELEDGVMTIALPDGARLEAASAIVGKQGVKIVLAAAAAAHMAGLTQDDIAKGVAGIKPFAGRMQILEGIHDSILIDDTYNASPPAVKAALDVLYATKAPQRIAILGSMNQMGDYSPDAHREVGAYCDAGKLDLVVTIGSDAETYLAPAAREAGCEVQSFASPYQVSEFVKSRLKAGGIVLAEGSQDGVFAEEALKALLKHPKDQSRLVRQSAHWMKIKREQFLR